jgi:hypothetical protein
MDLGTDCKIYFEQLILYNLHLTISYCLAVKVVRLSYKDQLDVKRKYSLCAECRLLKG